MNVHKGLFPRIKAVAEKKSISNASSPPFHSFFVQLLRKENLYVVPDEKKNPFHFTMYVEAYSELFRSKIANVFESAFQ